MLIQEQAIKNHMITERKWDLIETTYLTKGFLRFRTIMYMGVLIFLAGLFLLGCNSKIPNYIVFKTFYKDNSNNLVIEFTNLNDTIHKFMLVDGVWIATNTSNLVNRDKIIYDTTNHNITVKDSNNKTIFTDTNLPTIKDIELATDKNLTNRKIYYSAYRDGKNFTWDRTTHLISACNDENHQCLQFFAIKQKDIYNIGFLKLNPIRDIKLNLSSSDFSRISLHDLVRYSTSSKASACFTDENLVQPPQSRDIKAMTDNFTCLQRENNNIIEKKMFGDIYPSNYLKSMANITNAYLSTGFIPIHFFFDEKDNLHLFYHTSENNADKYISYAMFTPDEPSIPKNKQKIYWK